MLAHEKKKKEVITINPIMIGIIGLAAGVLGTGAGGVITALTGKPSKKTLGFYLGFAGGIMLALVFAELIPEALEEGSLILTMFGLVLGVALLILLDIYLPHIHHGGNPDDEVQVNGRMTRMGYLLAFGIALHNFPEGIAIGAGFGADYTLGISLAIILALHNIPEGIAMAVPLWASGLGTKKVVLATLLAGVPVGIGAYLGSIISHISPVFLTLSLGFAAGAMLYISFDELLPEAHNHSEGSHYGIYGGVIGVLIGYILIALF